MLSNGEFYEFVKVLQKAQNIGDGTMLALLCDMLEHINESHPIDGAVSQYLLNMTVALEKRQ